jgi:glycosyltransferase involved in cell wall biosynthesis
MNVLPILVEVTLFRPHVLHAHYARIYGWLAALTFFRPLVVTVWGGDILEDQGAFADALGRKLTPFALRRADIVTAHSRFLRDRVVSLGKPSSAVRLVGCPGVDRKLFRPGLNADAFRRELGLVDRRVVYCPRIMDELYNTEVIVRAIPTVLKQVPGASFVFSEHMGNLSYIQRMKLLVSDLGVKDAVVFLSTLPYERLPLLQNMAEALVSIPDSDGMPVSLLEGMACGNVPVVSDLPQYEGVIRNRENALTVNQKDPESVAGAVIRLLKDRPFRNRLSVAAVNTTAEGGDYETEMARMEKLYLELASNNNIILRRS